MLASVRRATGIAGTEMTGRSLNDDLIGPDWAGSDPIDDCHTFVVVQLVLGTRCSSLTNAAAYDAIVISVVVVIVLSVACSSRANMII